MSAGTSTHWNAVEQWSPTLFLVAGGLLVGHATVQGIEAFTATTTPPDVFVTTGHLVALVGLLGLYPVLVERTPRLARVAGAVTVVALAGWVVLTGTQVLTVIGAVSSPNALPGAVGMLVPVSTTLTYVLFGGATLRVAGESPTVGLLVLAPAALFMLLLLAAVVVDVSAVLGVIIGGGFALSMLALGARLRSWDRPTEHATPPPDATAG